MHVYRFEHPLTDKGPYRSLGAFKYESIEWEFIELMVDEHRENRDTHPGPIMDEMDSSPLFDIYGCPSLEKLHSWFDGFTDYLLNMGFHIIEYIVPDDKIIWGKSGLQVAFDPSYCAQKNIFCVSNNKMLC